MNSIKLLCWLNSYNFTFHLIVITVRRNFVTNGRIFQINAPTYRKAGYVVVQHTPDLFSRYVFVENITVNENEFVSAGTPLGTIARRSNGDHDELQFELFEDYEAIDPKKYLTTE